jgi:hypothetical protein
MVHNFNNSKELYYCRVRVPKDEAYFVYFTLESNEGLSYFSTVDESLKGQYRDIDLKCSIELKESLEALLKSLQAKIRLDVIHSEVIKDS